MDFHKSNQSGFGVVEIILVLVLIGILGFTGWYIWHTQQTSNNYLTSSNAKGPKFKYRGKSPSSSQTTQNSQTSSTSENQQYLVISQWGVKVTLTPSIGTAYYTVSDTDKNGVADQIDLSLQSLKNTQCKAGGWPPAEYFRYTSADADPVTNELYTTEWGSTHKIGNYYYAFEKGNGVSPPGSCQSTTAIQAIANNAATSFEAALNTVQPTN